METGTGPARLLLYGAYGFTGKLIAAECLRRGLRPVLAGRNAARTRELAAHLGLDHHVFALDRPEAIARELQGFQCLLLCAGPFSHTAPQSMDACIKAGTHYVDITGELDIIEAAASRHAAARGAGVTLLPAAGFDVVPTDCLAAALAEKLPGATHLVLALASHGGVSPGTAKTMLEGLPRGGRARVEGQIVRVPLAWKTREIPFRAGPRLGVTIPWGDLASAYHSTGIPNIEVYAAASPRSIARLRRARWTSWVAQLGLVRNFLLRRIERTIAGPPPEKLAAARASLWGEVTGPGGARIAATMETQGGYTFTAFSAVSAAERILAGKTPAGFLTPSLAFGRDFALTVPGTDLRFSGS